MSLEALLARGVQDGVFPLARLEVFHRDEHVLSLGNAGRNTVFDLASVTKVMCTTALILEEQLAVESALRRWLPRAAADVTLADLLFHRSGLPAFLPFFAQALAEHPSLLERTPEVSLRTQAREEVLARVGSISPTAPAGTQSVYSDLGFILLGHVLEASSGSRLDRLFEQRIASPLGLTAGFRPISAALPIPVEYAPTGRTRPREPAPGQEGLWSTQSVEAVPAQVDDDNAFVLDGVSGHAGLFGTALDVARFGQAILEGRWAHTEPWGRDGTAGSTRALGFDTPSAQGASCGPRFGRGGPAGAIGHLGFTGTSLWIDLDRRLVVALLTNRVALGRANVAIREFRPLVHDAVLDALSLK